MEIGSVTYVIEVFAVVTVLFQYRQIELDFMMIGKWAEQKRMKKELRIIILFLFVITFAHIFVLVIYYISHRAYSSTSPPTSPLPTKPTGCKPRTSTTANGTSNTSTASTGQSPQWLP